MSDAILWSLDSNKSVSLMSSEHPRPSHRDMDIMEQVTDLITDSERKSRWAYLAIRRSWRSRPDQQHRVCRYHRHRPPPPWGHVRSWQDHPNTATISFKKRSGLTIGMIQNLLQTHFLLLLLAPVSRNPLANGLWSIFSCVIFSFW